MSNQTNETTGTAAKSLVVVTIALLIIAVGWFFFDPHATVSGATHAVQDFLFFTPKPEPIIAASATAPEKKAPLTGFAAKFSDRLISSEGGVVKDVDSSTLSGVKYWAFYYSASWCPPCRAFTPDLVSFYRDFKPSHPNFELIFVDDDQDETGMLNYMANDAMPWPAVRFGETDNPDLDAKKYCGSGIPCLVLVDADGRVLSDTFQNGQYTDPHHVIDDIRATVQ